MIFWKLDLVSFNVIILNTTTAINEWGLYGYRNLVGTWKVSHEE